MGRGTSERNRFNVGVISEWHLKGEEFALFLSFLKPGDLIEFQRDGYCHWAVFIGDHALTECLDDGNEDFVTVLPCIVHRANPTDNPENLGGISGSFRSLNKGAHGIGDVVVEPLRDVWGRSKARVNNSMDNMAEPFYSSQIVERVLGVVHGEDRQAYTAYNVVTNNCEHFATWARNGWSISGQVSRKSEQLVKLGGYLVAGVALLPRPLSILGGLCVAGMGLINELRREEDDSGTGSRGDTDNGRATQDFLQITDRSSSPQLQRRSFDSDFEILD